MPHDLSWQKGAVCPHDCPDTCAIELGFDEAGELRGVRGRKDHPVTAGWLCAKVRDYQQLYHHPDRLLYPLRRRGDKGSGLFERVSWDEALSEIAERWQAIIAKSGGAAILPYSYSGTLGLVQMGISSQRLWNRMGASGLDRAICGAAAETVVRTMLGARISPRLADLKHCHSLILWGHNPATTAPHSMPFIRAAQRAGCTVVLIDPRRTLTSRSVKLHVTPKPATDGALALGIAHVLFRDGHVDREWLEAHARGGEAFEARAAEYSPDRVSEICGIPVEEIEMLAELMATQTPMMIKTSDGVQRHQNGGQTVRAIASLPALLGQYGVRGGGLYYSSSDRLRWDAEAAGKASDCPPTPRTINMNRLGAALISEARDPRIESLYVFGANPVASAPNAPKIIEGLKRDDLFTVVHEQFLTDTARYADIVLPATTQLEQLDLHRPYGHDVLALNQPLCAVRGEAKSNWDTMRALAEAMGYDEPWLKADAREVIEEMLAAAAKSDPRFAELTVERLEREQMVVIGELLGQEVPFAGGVFATPSGKIELQCDALKGELGDDLPAYVEPEELRPRDDGGLVLLSGASHHFISSSLYPLERLQKKEGPPTLEMHPLDAAERGIQDGVQVCIKNARGSFTAVAKVDDIVRHGVVVALKGHWPSGSPDGRNVNWTTPDRLGDLAGQSTFHSNRVWVERV
jgi:anaerobic selenocysteine-containing dehydrogenase